MRVWKMTKSFQFEIKQILGPFRLKNRKYRLIFLA